MYEINAVHKGKLLINTAVDEGSITTTKPGTTMATATKTTTTVTSPSSTTSSVRPYQCGGIINADQGIFGSPGYPANYESNLECVWFLSSPTRKDIILNFTDVDVSIESFDT